jgi:rod shape-determining protein MreB
MKVKARDAKTGTPRTLDISSTEICGVLYKSALRIADEVLAVLEDTSAELVGDITETGIVLTGGGSQLWGMDVLLSEQTHIPCTIADDPAACVAYGCGRSLGWITRMNDGPINLARKRLMRG